MTRLLNLLIGACMSFMAGIASANNYNVGLTWTDPTPTGANYSPTYNLEYRVNGGAVTAVNGLTSPAWSGTVAANPPDIIELRVQAVNTQGPLSGPWSTWASTTAIGCPTQPAGQMSLLITIQCQ